MCYRIAANSNSVKWLDKASVTIVTEHHKACNSFVQVGRCS